MKCCVIFLIYATVLVHPALSATLQDLIVDSVKSITPTILQVNMSRVIINASDTLVHPHPYVVPTTEPVEHLPGVPPAIGSGSTPGLLPPSTPSSTPVKPMRPAKPVKPAQSDNPFTLLLELFEKIKGQRLPSGLSSSEVTNYYLQTLTDAQKAQLYDLLNHTRYNHTSEFEQMVSPNKGFLDWLMGITGFGKPNADLITSTPTTVGKVCPSCACGESFKRTRIVGGIETQVNAYPWMAYLKYNGRFYCGASVISNKYLLTASHCVNGFNKDRLEITLLDHDRSTPLETQTISVKVANILKHTRYNQGASYNNDIALIKVDQDLDFKGLLRPVCLPTPKKSFTGYTAVVTGWGAIEEHGAISNKLREVEVPIIANANCMQMGYGRRITENMLCAGYNSGKKDSCQGDSGGPLHVRNDTKHEIVGIVSWGEGCAEANYPGVYTRVNRYLTWIHSNTKDACYCGLS